MPKINLEFENEALFNEWKQDIIDNYVSKIYVEDFSILGIDFRVELFAERSVSSCETFIHIRLMHGSFKSDRRIAYSDAELKKEDHEIMLDIYQSISDIFMGELNFDDEIIAVTRAVSGNGLY